MAITLGAVAFAVDHRLPFRVRSFLVFLLAAFCAALPLSTIHPGILPSDAGDPLRNAAALLGLAIATLAAGWTAARATAPDTSLHAEALLSHRSSLAALTALAIVATQLLSCVAMPQRPLTPVPADSAKVVMRQGLVAALQADGDSAVVLLRRVRPADLDPAMVDIRACMLARLDGRVLPPAALADTVVGTVLGIYHDYWVRALRHDHSAMVNEARLRSRLDSLVQRLGGPPALSQDSIERVLGPMLRARGYHALFGVTSPLRELMLWREETERRYDVALPLGRQEVAVVFLEGFASLGWAGFATCDRHHTGGWTKPDRLYAVRSAYDTTSETFRVSYLAHEGQHFWDTQHLAEGTPAHRLEYRAKLAELAVGQASVHGLLAQFGGNTSTDPTRPHSHANGRVVDRMAATLFPGAATTPGWRSATIEQINAAARVLLHADSSGVDLPGR